MTEQMQMGIACWLQKWKKEEYSVNIRLAEKADIENLSMYDKYIRKEELESIISLGRVIVVEDSGKFIGWLRWNLFWDNTPFINMLFILEEYRSSGYGKAIIGYWEKLMRADGYELVTASSLSNEAAQHFYRKLKYVDSGSLLLPGESLEIIFRKGISECIFYFAKKRGKLILFI